MGWTLYTLELLRKIPGLELTVLDSQCCGIAGTYGFKKPSVGLSLIAVSRARTTG